MSVWSKVKPFIVKMASNSFYILKCFKHKSTKRGQRLEPNHNSQITNETYYYTFLQLNDWLMEIDLF